MISANLMQRINVKVYRVKKADSLNLRTAVDSDEKYEIVKKLVYKEAKDDLFDTRPRVETRFGENYEDRIIYSSYERETAFAEFAFRTFLFVGNNAAKFNDINRTIICTKFNASSQKFIDLTGTKFKKDKNRIDDPSLNYEFTKRLGNKMRNNKTECFKFKSTRVLHEDKFNFGIFKPSRVINNKHKLNINLYYVRFTSKVANYFDHSGQFVEQLKKGQVIGL